MMAATYEVDWRELLCRDGFIDSTSIPSTYDDLVVAVSVFEK
jgi:hypothetical protein